MARNTKREQETPNNDLSSMKLGLKEIITIITFIVSLMIGYFGIVKDIETRLVRIETRFEELNKKIYALNEDLQLKSSPIEDKLSQNLLSKKDDKHKVRDKKSQRDHHEKIISDPPIKKEEEE